jgi:hypothetical protein
LQKIFFPQKNIFSISLILKEYKMKKLVILIALIAILGTGSVFADHPSGFGIGVQGGWSGGPGGGAGLTLKFPSLPIFFSIDGLGLFGGSGFHISGAGDYYFIDKTLVPEAGLNWYLGFGIGVALWGFDGDLGLAASARLPIGLSWQPIDLLEIYLQAVPQIGLQILPDIGLWGNFWGGNLGIRFWF